MSLTKMSLLRNTNLSLFFKIRETLSTPITREVLERVNETQYKSKNKRWLETVSPEVYIDQKLQKPQAYYIDYAEGVITFVNEVSSTSEVDCSYKYCVVEVFDDYPDIDSEYFKVPAVSIVHENTEEEPYQLTHGKQVERYYIIEVYAERAGQRDDLAEAIKEMFDAQIEIIDFNKGFPVINGEVNIAYNPHAQTIGLLELDGINMTSERSIDRGSGEKYIMSIDVTLISYRD